MVFAFLDDLYWKQFEVLKATRIESSHMLTAEFETPVTKMAVIWVSGIASCLFCHTFRNIWIWVWFDRTVSRIALLIADIYNIEKLINSISNAKTLIGIFWYNSWYKFFGIVLFRIKHNKLIFPSLRVKLVAKFYFHRSSCCTTVLTVKFS